MKVSRSLFSVLSISLLLSSPAFASGPAVAQSGTPATMVDGPAPVPICPPEEGWCNTLPMPRPIDGPAPVPICPPEEGWCNTLPMPRPIDGPAPVPICPPEEGWCNTLPIPRPIDGPAPVPICPPESKWCNTLPIPRPIANDEFNGSGTALKTTANLATIL